MNIQTATPAEIDTQLGDLYVEAATLRIRRENLISALGRMVGLRPGREKPGFRDTRPRAEDDQAIIDAAQDVREASTYLERLEEVREDSRINREAQAPLHAEFTRRNGWTRAFLVQGGHIHSSMSCGTCYPDTRYVWLPEVSGHDEAEIVTAAGEGACTVCYPTAPAVGPRTLLSKDEKAAQAARDAKAEAKAAKDAKRAAGTLLAPVRTGRDTVRTVAAAKSYLTDWFEWEAIYADRRDGGLHPSFQEADRSAVAEALAAKTGDAVEVILTAAVKRAANRK